MKSLIFILYICTILPVAAQQKLNKKLLLNLPVKTVMLDNYFNNEYRINKAGETEPFHYTWEDTEDSGFSQLGSIFKEQGSIINQLCVPPTLQNLYKASVYIIVDPDTETETVKPNYITAIHANTIYKWVKKGGILLLLMNDSSKADFFHTNKLAAKFGMHFIQNSLNKVGNQDFEKAAFTIPINDSIFKSTKKVYIKELASIQLSKPAKAHYTNAYGDVIMATAQIGKGKVFALGDPWFYNEYMDNRILPNEFENYKAAQDLVRWLIK